MIVCKICGNYRDNRSYAIREMMFGYKDKFEYIECSQCDCLQIGEIPLNLEKYYPTNYYSYADRDQKMYNPLNRFISAQKTRYWLNGRNPIGILATLGRKKAPPYFIAWFKGIDVKLDYRILDIGSGTGELLIDMRQYGFQKLIGIDPFIKEDIFYKNGVKIFKKDIYKVDGKFDLIILNGSFEHTPDPLSVLKKVSDLLKPKSYVFMRIPLTSTFAWRKYGVNWVQIDAPRHLFLHTLKSMKLLSTEAGLIISDIVFDSYGMQFWGSEQYLRGIPLMGSLSYLINPKKSIFSEKQIEDFKKQSCELNQKKDGDQACFYLYKA